VEFLSGRISDVGGGVSSAVSPANFSLRDPRLVLLVHGYNVNLQSGQDGYSAFGTLLEKYGVRSLSVLGQIVGFCWPGDVNIRYISGLFYPRELGPAKASAALLANFLLRLRGPQDAPIQVILVAHSLGNRLALELIKDILDQPHQTWGRIEGVCLMAAAVPVQIVDNNNRLARAARAARCRNLFSQSDTILHWAFPPGETFAGDGFFPQAVGLFGNPLSAWTERFDLQPYNHGDYFRGKGMDARSARYVAQFLGAAVPTQPSLVQPTANSLPTPNVIASRRIGGS